MSRLARVLEAEVMDDAAEVESYAAMDHSEPLSALVRRLCELGARGRVLDIGTGPGHLLIDICAALPECRVVGVDLSANMLACAEQRRVSSPYADRIELRLADAKGLEFAHASFDTVVSNTILHHIEDPRPFLAEAWRVLKPNGVLCIRDLYRPADEDVLEELVALHAADCDEVQKKMLADSLRAALTPDELRAAAAEAGMSGVKVVVDTDRHMTLQKAANARG